MMEPLALIVTHMPSDEEFAQGWLESRDGTTNLEFRVVHTGKGANPEDHIGTVRIVKITELRTETRDGYPVIYFTGLTGKSNIVPQGRHANGLALDTRTQKGEIFVTDLR